MLAKLIDNFSSPIDVEFFGTPSIGATIELQARSLKFVVGRDYKLRVDNGIEWRIRISDVQTENSASAEVTGNLTK